MSLKKGQRLKLLKLWEILQQETDKDHTLSTSELLLRLKNIGIVCDRRTLYADIKALNENGYRNIKYVIESNSGDLYNFVAEINGKNVRGTIDIGKHSITIGSKIYEKS